MFNFIPQPIFFEIGFIRIHYYGFLITAAIILGFLLNVNLAKKYKIKKDQILDLYFWLIIFGIIGARLYHVASEWGYYSTHLLDIPKVYNGGLGIFGAIFAGLIVIWIYSKKLTAYSLQLTVSSHNTLTFWLLLDILSPALILGLALGRWGNFFNQELFGPPCNFFWCIPIDLAHRPETYTAFTHFHPTFLYESLASFAIFAILLILHKIRIRKQYNNITIQQFNKGSIFLTLIILYTAFRFLNEFLRIDPQPEFLTLRLAQWVSGGLFILGLALLISKLKKPNKPIP